MSASQLVYRGVRKHARNIEQRVLVSWIDETALAPNLAVKTSYAKTLFSPLIERVGGFPYGPELSPLDCPLRWSFAIRASQEESEAISVGDTVEILYQVTHYSKSINSTNSILPAGHVVQRKGGCKS